MLTTLLLSLMVLWEEQAVTPLSFKGLELDNESPPCGGYPHTPDAIFKWEWFSEPLDCPPDVNPNRWWER
ncbi:hypothetical protein [Stygiolobus sp. CP850M]|uniref:hypothetical protein n=1 Tax=Stygiolobus sp. CP850M TaxID=3133134 RepID=UPI00307E2DD4